MLASMRAIDIFISILYTNRVNKIISADSKLLFLKVINLAEVNLANFSYVLCLPKADFLFFKNDFG